LNSSNGLVVIFTIAKLIKILKPYTENGKLDDFDLNLFKRFYPEKPEEPEKTTVLVKNSSNENF